MNLTHAPVDRDLALEQLDVVEAARTHLEHLYRIPPDDRDKRLVAGVHQDMGLALKLAEIHALLNIGAQLEALRSAAS